jgi:hypothetical protein
MKFSSEYKNKIREIFLVGGIQKAFEAVWREHPKTTKRTIKTWVDDEYNKRVQQTRRKSHIKVKTEKPELYAEKRKKADEKAKHLRKTDPEYRKYRKKFGDRWTKNNPDKVKGYQKDHWYNRGGKEKRLAHIKKRKSEDLGFRLLENSRARAYPFLKKALNLKDGENKPESMIALFGCNLSFLADHFRKQYRPGMSDENYGEWEMDHIKPCSLFDFTKEEDRKACWHYSNLQPLWKEENKTKSDYYEETNNG